jgi:hypothetical protein
MAATDYEITLDEDVEHMLEDFPGDFAAVLRKRLPSLADALALEPLEPSPWRFVVTIESGQQGWEVVCVLEEKDKLSVLGVYPKLRSLPKLSRKEALADKVWNHLGV